MTKVLLVDTGIWFALLDPDDSARLDPAIRADLLRSIGVSRVLVPWPTLYEVLGTRFVKRAHALARLDEMLKAPNVTLLDDTSYRLRARTECLGQGGRRALSLVDICLRLVIQDGSNRVRMLASLNRRDFDDVCRPRNIPIIPTRG